MSDQADRLSDINKKHRQRILLLKNRTQNMFNRPSPVTSQKAQNYQFIKYPTNTAKANTFDFLKQYQSNKTSQQNDVSSISKDKSFDYNSTLFKNIKQQSHIAQKPSQFINNGSHISGISSNSQLGDSNQNFKDSKLLNKIDELLKQRKIDQAKGGIRNVYDEYLQKKSHMSSSSGFSNNNSSASVTSQFKVNGSQLKSKSYTNSFPNKLKTIQEQKRTIQKQQNEAKTKQQHKRQADKKNPSKKPPLPLPSNSTIDRQKQKIKQTMMELKEQKDSYQFQDKSSLILELSDNESQLEEKPQKEKNQQKVEKQKTVGVQVKAKISKLNEQKQMLTKQLQRIEKQLQNLEKQQESQDEYQ